jgi:Pretoxin HINT domain
LLTTTTAIASIKNIKVGDWVIADDPTTVSEIEAKRVLELFQHSDYQLLDLVVDGEAISVTPNHEFWVVDRGWVNAEDLGIGDRLWTDDRRSVDVDSVSRREGSFQVYNFEVDGFHTYFVSDWGVLVHNCDIPRLQLSRDDFSIKASISGDPKAYIRAELPEPGVVNVTDIFRGNLPKGSGGDFLAEALKGHNTIPSKQLVITNINNLPTFKAYENGIDPSESILGKTAKTTLEKLGLQPSNFRFEMSRGKLNLKVDIK